MALQTVSNNRVTPVNLGTADNLRLEQDGLINVSGSISVRAVSGKGTENGADIYGDIYSTGYGVDLGTESTSTISHKVYVGSQAEIHAVANAVVLSGGGGTLTNFGIIESTTQIAVRFSGGGTTGSLLENHGTITGLGGIVCYGQTAMRIENSGTITSTGDSSAILSASDGSRDVVINTGTITGSIHLGLGNDLYNGIGGHRDGAIYCDDGNDRVVLGSNDLGNVFAGTGRDTLDLRGFVNGTTISLYGSGGPANKNDVSFVDFEVVTGSRTGNDRIFANEIANSLYGNGGNDRLFGGGGADALLGGAGNDRLFGGSGADALLGGAGDDRLSGDRDTDVMTGGTGNDSFVINDQDDGFDYITDFRNVAGNNDVFRIDASGFNVDLGFGALAAGKFWSSTTNQAHDANDRFIFRTTDATLWYDANGNAAGGLQKIADLQAGATMTAADIILI